MKAAASPKLRQGGSWLAAPALFSIIIGVGAASPNQCFAKGFLQNEWDPEWDPVGSNVYHNSENVRFA